MSGNTEASGAKVTLRTSAGKQYREVHFENNYVSRSPSQVHIGLGKETQVEKLQVQFAEPDKRKVVIDSPEINQLYVVSQTQKSK